MTHTASSVLTFCLGGVKRAFFILDLKKSMFSKSMAITESQNG